MNNDWVNDYLMHSGVKGMRWGVLRYQNPDGSLTPLGRLRYRLRYLKGGRNEDTSSELARSRHTVNTAAEVGYRIRSAGEKAASEGREGISKAVTAGRGLLGRFRKKSGSTPAGIDLDDPRRAQVLNDLNEFAKRETSWEAFKSDVRNRKSGDSITPLIDRDTYSDKSIERTRRAADDLNSKVRSDPMYTIHKILPYTPEQIRSETPSLEALYNYLESSESILSEMNSIPMASVTGNNEYDKYYKYM